MPVHKLYIYLFHRLSKLHTHPLDNTCQYGNNLMTELRVKTDSVMLQLGYLKLSERLMVKE
jgi:hypothetical protein